MVAERPSSIPILVLVRSAVQLLVRQRDDAMRLGVLPLVICFGGLLYGLDAFRAALSAAATDPTTPPPEGLLVHLAVMMLCSLIAYSIATVNWLRFVLSGSASAAGLGHAIGKPHVGYLLSCIGIGIVAVLLLSIASMPFGALPAFAAEVVQLMLSVLMLGLCTRFIPFLVAIAIGQPMSLRESWAASRGNAVPVLIALALTYMPFVLVAMIVDAVLSVVGFTDAAPIATMFIMSVIQVTAWFCQAGVFAIAFRHMVGVRV